MTIPLDSPPVLLVAGLLGYLLRNSFSNSIKKLLGNVNIVFFMPIVMGVTFAKRGFMIEDLWVAGAVVFYTITITTPLALITRNREPRRRASIIVSSIFPNSVNLPLPILLAIRGDYSYAAVFAIVINLIHIIYVSTLASLLLARTRGRKNTITFFIKGMTPLYGAVAGYYMGQYSLVPTALWGFLEQVRSLGIFMFVLVAGLSMPTLNVSRIPWDDIKTIAATRFVASPLLVIFYAWTSGLLGISYSHEALVQVLVESVMPPAVINVSYSAAFGFDTEVTALGVVVTTLPGAFLGSLIAFTL